MFNLTVAILSISVPFANQNNPRTLERAIFVIGYVSRERHALIEVLDFLQPI
jgi:hypothetical protein